MITLLNSYVVDSVKEDILKSKAIMQLAGLSTDNKPKKSYNNIEIENGSSFIEIDTSKHYKYDKENDIWFEQTKKYIFFFK